MLDQAAYLGHPKDLLEAKAEGRQSTAECRIKSVAPEPRVGISALSGLNPRLHPAGADSHGPLT